MNKFWMGLVLSGIVAVGCSDKGGDSGDTAAEEADTDTDTDTDADPDFSVSWGSASVDVTSDCTACTEFGMAETNAGCEAAGECWTGEDCLYGYELSDGSTLLYCHPMSGGSVSLSYGGSATALVEGSETVFPDNSYDGDVTYYAGAGADCYIWGADKSYYDGLGCTSL